MEMPPMPDPDDFRDASDYLSSTAYSAALAAWERVAKHLIDAAHLHHAESPVSAESHVK